MLNTVARISLCIAFTCTIIIAIDAANNPQKMWIMNIVWPVTALYFSVSALWAYFVKGREMTKDAMQGRSKEAMEMQQEGQSRRSPTWGQTGAVSTFITHLRD